MKILQNQSHAQVRGFNYQPSYGSSGLEIWGDAFDAELIAVEMGHGKRHFPGINTLRLWLSHDAWIRHGQVVAERFEAALAAAASHDLKVIATLFNGWHSWPNFGGITVEQMFAWRSKEGAEDVFTPFLDAMVSAHRDDPRILLWDLCNEPFNTVRSAEATATIYQWLEGLYARCKELGATAPVCVGSIPSVETVRQLEPISDVITFHPYYAWNTAWCPSPEHFEQNVDATVELANAKGKALLGTETGWGALDDAKRAEVLAVELGALAARGIGFTAHLLHHTLVADGHRPGHGPISPAGYMAFVEKDGSLRPHHDCFNRY